MREPAPLAAVLRRYIEERGYAPDRLARDAGIPKQTVHRWLSGEVARPHTWHGLLKVAASLGLGRAQADELLRAAQRPSLDELASRAETDEDKALVSRWTLASHSTLPGRLTSFVGREEEVERLTGLLSRARLVTLTGAPGCGKTRLAIEAAEALAHTFGDGAHFVPLAPIADPRLVVPTIATALGIPGGGGAHPEERLRAHLHDRHLLLILDNVEHLLAAAATITQLLQAAPRLVVVVTSRVILHATGEHEFAVRPFPLPGPGAPPAVLAANPAVALFVDRAQAVRPAFALTRENADAVAQICRRLEGLPLAIELAAARIRYFDPSTLLRRFPNRLELGGDGAVDAPPHHQSLRATIAWSCDLLEPPVRRLFARLGVFAGGFTEESARAVCDEDLGGTPSRLWRLLDANLLRRLEADSRAGTPIEPRYGMLEMIREYAQEKLKESGEAEELRQRHGEYFLRLAEGAAPAVRGPEAALWLDRLESEHDNLRAALSRSLDRGDTETALRLGAALMGFWHERGHVGEGRRWLDRALSGGGAPPHARARALGAAGILAHRQNDYGRAQDLLEECLGLYREAGDIRGIALTTEKLGTLAMSRHDYSRARTLCGESLGLFRELGDERGAANCLNRLAWMALFVGEHQEAVRHAEESLSLYRALGDTAHVASSYLILGIAALHRDQWDRATELFEESLRLSRALEDEWRTSQALLNLGRAELLRGNRGRAAELFRESLGLHPKVQDDVLVADCLDGLAGVAAASGDPVMAARLAGAAEGVHEGMGVLAPVRKDAFYDRVLAETRSRVDKETWEGTWREGRGLSIEEAVGYALDRVR